MRLLTLYARVTQYDLVEDLESSHICDMVVSNAETFVDFLLSTEVFDYISIKPWKYFWVLVVWKLLQFQTLLYNI